MSFTGNIPLACSSCRCAVNGGMYLRDGFFYNIANHCDVLCIFAPIEFLQLGRVIFISSKRFPVRRSSVFQTPIQWTETTCPTSCNCWFWWMNKSVIFLFERNCCFTIIPCLSTKTTLYAWVFCLKSFNEDLISSS